MNNEIYTLVGKIIEGVQTREYLLVDGVKMAKILNVFNKYNEISENYYHKIEQDVKKLTDEMENMTFGNIVNLIRVHEVLSNDDIEYLESILSKRNQLVHKYFKHSDFELSDEVKYNYLQKFYSDINEFINYLNEVIEEMKEDYERIK